MAIKKGRIVIDFMYDDTEFSDEHVKALSVGDILDDMDIGGMIGTVTFHDAAEVVDVRAKLIEMGNDGKFFDEP